MSQRKMIVASFVITLVFALSAIGIRAAFFDSNDASADPESGLTLVVPGSGEHEEDDGDAYEGSASNPFEDSRSNHDDDDSEDHEDEEDHEDD